MYLYLVHEVPANWRKKKGGGSGGVGGVCGWEGREGLVFVV